MTETRTRESTVEVSADPQTAFTAFTDELDLWWVRGPINAYDSGRLVEMRCEPGVGGRILEVYEGDALELARITAWQPGTSWRGSGSRSVTRAPRPPRAGWSTRSASSLRARCRKETIR
jgi:uncharacterized protein YndB with AHSA1/START domain